MTDIRGLAVFTAPGSGALAPIGSSILKSGDPVLSVWDITTPFDATTGFGTVLVATSAGVGLSILQEAGAPAVGHTCVALIGIGPAV